MKIKHTYRFDEQTVEKLVRLAGENTDHNKTALLEALIERAPEVLPRQIMVHSLNPFSTSGDTWDGEYTGFVEALFPVPSRVSIVRMTIKVEKKTFDWVLREIYSFS